MIEHNLTTEDNSNYICVHYFVVGSAKNFIYKTGNKVSFDTLAYLKNHLASITLSKLSVLTCSSMSFIASNSIKFVFSYRITNAQ